ncbi:trypsin-like peptidase domain-containing protein [Chromatocurvus halotolerans]|uniref:Probable periplasmic serine endoprotease DegP-like n=1 Tax=Chromatocurvus halotolerans TaxID=1132028 RepID=A0A4R2L1W0_9GAMM|nr:trypsin-like peptidase domain-containing protein [Chromatocurvus halotolerans]TCO77726.1 serine protease Do [Chromatocurvus halotolerans]
MPTPRSLAQWLLLSAALLATGLHAQGLPDFRDIVADNSAAVVKILVEQEAGAPAHPGFDSDEIPEYLRRFFEDRGAPPGPRQRMSMGSGFIISDDGYIVTNNHVVERASSVVVRLSDRREYDAEVIGLDERSDLALLRIEGEDLPVARLDTTDRLDVGEWVLAVGSPFGLDYSVTAGIVSAKGRSLPTERNENYVPFIQTDVAINPGNSGGPLFNLDGEVVGVNSQIFTRSGGSIGLSFAIPVSVVRSVVEQLKESGSVSRGWLGVTIQDVDRNLAESFELDRPMGALIAQLAPGGPAEGAGFEPGDVIIEFAGQPVETSADLPHVVGLLRPGTEVDAVIVREGKRRTISVTVGGLDAGDDLAAAASGAASGDEGKLGILCENAAPDVLERWGLSGGVLVRNVEPGSPAADAGIRAGDVITMLANQPVQDLDTLRDVTASLRAGASVPVRLIRRGAPLFIGLRVPG